ncbi:MAG: hypothetical protein V7774_09130 [Pseudorhizobium pelagicum]|uniref:hypothetical protein n=1 Tax=Pseudorhizobium pelagicum TaxID=1509405 RepID=UPI00345FF159
MSFTGDDYNRVFEEACSGLAYERDEEVVRGKLLTMEWILWEALRGVFSLIAMTLSGLIVFPIAYLISPVDDRTWGGVVFVFIAFAVLATLIYWICRAVFHFEFAIKIRGRKFGSPF